MSEYEKCPACGIHYSTSAMAAPHYSCETRFVLARIAEINARVEFLLSTLSEIAYGDYDVMEFRNMAIEAIIGAREAQ